jgi:hypothetical protein
MNGLVTAEGTPQHQKTIPVMTGQCFDHDHEHSSAPEENLSHNQPTVW